MLVKNCEVIILSDPLIQIDESSLLIPLDDYLVSGIHIGTTIATKFMEPFIYRVRNDGLYVLNVKATDDRIRSAAKLLAKFEPETVAVFSSRQYATVPAAKMARIVGFQAVPGRFVPGTLTNPSYSGYMEPEIVFLNDPRTDKQALNEAVSNGIPVVALCDTDNITSFVDLVIPCNNKGRRALARIYHLLTQQILRERGELGPEETLEEKMNLTVDDFSFKLIK